MAAALRKASFQELAVWKLAMDLVVHVYRESATFPSHERFGLTSQVRRAAVSIPSCIAEGQARRTPREFARFISISLGSLAEVETQLLIAQRLGYGSTGLSEILLRSKEIRRMLHGLKNAILPTPN